jgi:cytochrome c5
LDCQSERFATMKAFPILIAMFSLLAAAAACAADQKLGQTVTTQGLDTYRFACARCHDRGINGAPKIGDRAAWNSRAPEWASVLESHAISGWIDMPAKGGYRRLSAADVGEAVGYLRVQLGAASMPSLASEDAEGRRVYLVSCSGCHSEGVGNAPKIGDRTAWRTLTADPRPVVRSHAINGYIRLAPTGGYQLPSEGDIEAAVGFMLAKSKNR